MNFLLSSNVHKACSDVNSAICFPKYTQAHACSRCIFLTQKISQLNHSHSICDAPEPLAPVSGLPADHPPSAPLLNARKKKDRPHKPKEEGTSWMMGNCCGSSLPGSGASYCGISPNKSERPSHAAKSLLPNMEDAQGTSVGGGGG